jgi:hypothetical protein
VSELQANEQVRGRTSRAFMLFKENFTQIPQIRRRMVVDAQLVWIRTTGVTHGDSFAAPDQLCATRSETSPATKR